MMYRCFTILLSTWHSEAAFERNSPFNKNYDYYWNVNGNTWVEWGVQKNLWNMFVFFCNWSGKDIDQSFGIQLIWIVMASLLLSDAVFDLGMESTWHLLIFLYYITHRRVTKTLDLKQGLLHAKSALFIALMGALIFILPYLDDGCNWLWPARSKKLLRQHYSHVVEKMPQSYKYKNHQK